MASKKTQGSKGQKGAAVPPPPLTKAEQQYLEAFGDLVEELKRSPQPRGDLPTERKHNPTVEDVSQHLGKSESAAQQPLKNLEQKGYLENEWGWRVIGKKLAPAGMRWLAYRRGER